jgi:hypothetical protein
LSSLHKSALAALFCLGLAVPVFAQGGADKTTADINAAQSTLQAIRQLGVDIKARQQRAMTEGASTPAPPANALVLFSGRPEELVTNWVRQGSNQPPTWQVEEGAMVTSVSSIVTKRNFKDFQLHVEFKVPFMPEAHGQERGNSGVGLLAIYEIQVLDSYGFKEPGSGDCGAVYSQSAPLVNACKPPLTWQTYDISFHAARFGADGKVMQKPRVTVFQNGICVQNNQEINGGTGIGGKDDVKEGPIYLQFHNNTVQFRNVWVVPLPEEGAKHYEPR